MVAGAYAVYGISGFGSTIIAVPLLAHVSPLAFAVPLVVLLDLVTSVALGSGFRRKIAWGELAPLLVLMTAGIAAGVGLLLRAPERPLLVALGVFVLATGSHRLVRGGPLRTIARGWVVPTGLAGGVVSGVFGTGGPLYIMYLARRLPDPTALRSSMAVVLLLSSVLRLALFGATGLASARVLTVTAVLVPVAMLGLYAGHRLHRRLAPLTVSRVVAALLVLSGISLILRTLP